MSDIILPVISLLPFLSRNLDEKFAILRRGPHYNGTISNGYNTVKQASEDGALVLAWGKFFDEIFRFLLKAVSLWIIAVTYSSTSGDNIVKRQVKCRYCNLYISEMAKRCVNCTTWLDGREDK